MTIEKYKKQLQKMKEASAFVMPHEAAVELIEAHEKAVAELEAEIAILKKDYGACCAERDTLIEKLKDPATCTQKAYDCTTKAYDAAANNNTHPPHEDDEAY